MHFEANLSAHAVVWGYDQEIVRASTVIDTDQGDVQPDGFRTPTASGSLDVVLFNRQPPIYHQDANPHDGFNYDFTHSENYDLPPVGIWIFSIQLGVNATVGLHT